MLQTNSSFYGELLIINFKRTFLQINLQLIVNHIKTDWNTLPTGKIGENYSQHNFHKQGCRFSQLVNYQKHIDTQSAVKTAKSSSKHKEDMFRPKIKINGSKLFYLESLNIEKICEHIYFSMPIT